jgi:hypothetical protein
MISNVCVLSIYVDDCIISGNFLKTKLEWGIKMLLNYRPLPTSTEIDVDLREPLLEITESQAFS